MICIYYYCSLLLLNILAPWRKARLGYQVSPFLYGFHVWIALKYRIIWFQWSAFLINRTKTNKYDINTINYPFLISNRARNRDTNKLNCIIIFTKEIFLKIRYF
jgi:hypothetical protein